MHCRPLLTLPLLHGVALAFLEQHVTLTKTSILTVRALGEECESAESILSSCANLPAASQSACLCCSSGTPLGPEFSSCATYLAKSSPTETSLVSAMVTLYGVCAKQTCATTLTGLPTVTIPRPPAECTAVASIYASCAEKMGVPFETPPTEEMAECLCHDDEGEWTTRFDGLSEVCKPFADEAAPDDAESFATFATFCSAHSAATAVTTTPAPTVPTAPTSPVSTTESTGAAAGVVIRGGMVAWLGGAALGLVALM